MFCAVRAVGDGCCVLCSQAVPHDAVVPGNGNYTAGKSASGLITPVNFDGLVRAGAQVGRVLPGAIKSKKAHRLQNKHGPNVPLKANRYSADKMKPIVCDPIHCGMNDEQTIENSRKSMIS